MALDFSPEEVRAYYAARVPGLKPSGGELRGPCPIHKGTRASFAVNPHNGQAYCHSQCARGWDIVGLERELSGATFNEAKNAVFRIVGQPRIQERKSFEFSNRSHVRLHAMKVESCSIKRSAMNQRTSDSDARTAEAIGSGT